MQTFSWIVSIGLVTQIREVNGVLSRCNEIFVDPNALSDISGIYLPSNFAPFPEGDIYAHIAVYMAELTGRGWERDKDYGLLGRESASRFWLTIDAFPLAPHEILGLLHEKFSPVSVDGEELAHVLLEVMQGA